MSAPCVLFASCSQIPPEELVKQVLGVDSLPDGENVVEDITAYDWSIDNKYYSSAVRLCTSQSRTIGNTEFADSVQAFVVHFDSKQSSSFEQVKSWLPFLKALEPDILMLVCDRCTDTDAVDRLTAQKFCIEHSFELVELSPEETDGEEEDDFQETTGIKRVIQALHAHTWPNLVMKDKPDIRSAYFRQLMQEEFQAKNDSLNSISSPSDEEFQDFVGCDSLPNSFHSVTQSLKETATSSVDFAQNSCSGSSSTVNQNQDCHSIGDNKKNCSNVPPISHLLKEGMEKKKSNKTEEQSSEERIDSLLGNDDMSLLAALGNDDPGDESFEQLFDRLRIMKDKADNLPPEERKAYAEKVAVSFWRAIGGDEGEVEGLDDSD